MHRRPEHAVMVFVMIGTTSALGSSEHPHMTGSGCFSQAWESAYVREITGTAQCTHKPDCSQVRGSVDVLSVLTGQAQEIEYKKIQSQLDCVGDNVQVLFHASDEYCTYPKIWELYPRFKLVIRQYACWPQYKDLYRKHTNVAVTPLGYNTAMQFGHGARNSTHAAEMMLEKLRMSADVSGQAREYMWAFAGTVKQDRANAMRAFDDFVPHPRKTAFPPTMLHRLYSDAHFVPCGRGNINLDCFRNYEASIAGAVPIVVGTESEISDTFGHFGAAPPWVFAKSWTDAVEVAKRHAKDQNVLAKMHQDVLEWWIGEMRRLHGYVTQALNGDTVRVDTGNFALTYTHSP
eukprot:m.530459 g.530459  ORF g.530459 m.530459 type:complete len:347 (+) comp22027_c1_seq9:261-1301(+)